MGFDFIGVTEEHVRALRDLGVSHFQWQPTTQLLLLKFHPPVQAVIPVSSEPLPDVTGEPMCRCRHPLSDHGEHGLCLRGCAEDACEVQEVK